LHFSHLALGAVAVASALARPGGGDHFIERVLRAHNQPRAELGLAPLRWNDGLAADAAIWARQLGRQRRLEHERQHGEGENLWMGTAGGFSYEQMVGSWAGERALYRHGVFPEVSTTGSWHDVGHYTQMVWRDTTEVGCAMAYDHGWDYLVCRYTPAGNWIGQRAY
jgi:uncharacterized protein YkwD